MEQQFGHGLSADGAERLTIYTPKVRPGFTAWTTCFDYGDGRIGLSFKETVRERDPFYQPPLLEMGEAVGAPVSLRWTFSGNPGQTVRLALINKADSDLITIVASTPVGRDGKGRYDWTVPKLKPGGDYYLAIASTTNAFYQDISKTPVVISAAK